MTLNTYIGLTAKPEDFINIRDFVNRELLETQKYTETVETRVGETFMNNQLGQGFPAWFSMEWEEGEKNIDWLARYGLADEESKERHFSYYEDKDQAQRDWDSEIESFKDYPEIKILLAFDTAYGYKDEQGRGCTQLHAHYIAELAAHYGDKTDIWWRNEYSGTWHKFDKETLDGFQEFLGDGVQAMSWFAGVVNTIEGGGKDGEDQ